MIHVIRILALLMVIGIAPVALAEGGHGFVLNEHGFYILDFAVLVFILWYFGKGPARTYLETRHDAVKEEMAAAMALKAEAEERLQRYESLLAGLEAEIADIREQFKQDGENERQRIIEEAEALTARIQKDATNQLTLEGAKLRDALESALTERAIALADDKIKEGMSANVQRSLVDQFIGELEAKTDLGILSN